MPIASLTKMMTALVVLRDHPLQLGQQGPSVRITSPEVAEYQSETAAGDSTVPVATGENLSEYQLLEGLLLPSGDNLADVLAVFDAASVSAFVAKMNETARVLGLFATHYVDTSGVNPASVSTADNQAIVASALMGYPVARAIVRQRHVRLPVAGVVPNWNPAIGVEGIIGVKSGWTSEAGSCLVTAAFRRIGHHSGLVISVTLGQPGGLTRPAAIDEELLATVTRSLVLATVLPGNSVVPDPVGSGQISLLAPSQPVVVLAWPGLLLETSISPAELNAAGLAASAVGSVVAELQVAAPWGVLATVPLRLGETPTVSSA